MQRANKKDGPTKDEGGRLGAANLGQRWASETPNQGIGKNDSCQPRRHKVRHNDEQAGEQTRGKPIVYESPSVPSNRMPPNDTG